MTSTSPTASNELKIDGCELIKGRFASFNLRSTSYYPTRKVQSRIALSLYQVDLQRDGLLSSQKYREDDSINDTVHVGTPFSMASAEGSFLLFLPEDKQAWGLMDIRRIISRRPDINLSLVSPLALMPYKLHIVNGGLYEHKSQFSVVDEEGSRWTLHCDVFSEK